MSTSDARLLDAVAGLAPSPPDEGWKTAIKDAVEFIAAAFSAAGGVGGAEAPRMRVSLESIFLPDPRIYRGDAQFTRTVPFTYAGACYYGGDVKNNIPVYDRSRKGVIALSDSDDEATDQSE